MIGKRGVISITILILAFVVSVYAGNPPTNEEFVAGAVSTEFVKLLDSLNIDRGPIVIESERGMNSLIADGAKSGALEKGLLLLNGKDGQAEYAYLITISLSSFDFNYSNGKSRGFFHRPYIKRNLFGQMLISITGADVNYLGFRGFDNSDEVEPGSLNYISSIRYNQLSPRPPGAGVKKYLEPLAVTATVGGLIYLFFINR